MKTQFFYQNNNQNRQYYKNLLDEMHSIKLRRMSKFNLLAIWGALKCLENVNYKKRTNIYLISKYGTLTDVVQTFEDQKNNISLSPFDFLNINISNTTFYIAKILQTSGTNQIISTKNNSLKDAIKMANFDMHEKLSEAALVGLVDESANGILGVNSDDISKWMYFDEPI